MKSINTLLGWLLMLAVLAIPSFLFYNWWSKNKVQGSGEAAMEMPAQDVFSKAGQKDSPAPATEPPQASPAQSAISLVQTSSAPVTAAATETLPEKKVATSETTEEQPAKAEELDEAPVTEQKPQQAATSSTGPAKRSYFTPKSGRNPMLSSQELAQIKQAEQDRMEAERQAQMSSQPRKVRDTGIENRIKLQGVVGNAAIINGEMYYQGQTILGGKLLKVAGTYIIMEYKGKKFRKNMN